MKSISSADANRHFSALLREVLRGKRVTVTSRGKPIAIISAPDPGGGAERLAAKRVAGAAAYGPGRRGTQLDP